MELLSTQEKLVRIYEGHSDVSKMNSVGPPRPQFQPPGQRPMGPPGMGPPAMGPPGPNMGPARPP